MSTVAQDTTTPVSIRERLLAWKEILETANPPATRPLDTVGKWLVITRAAVFPMTIWSGLIGGLLAVTAAATTTGLTVDYWLLTISVVGLVLAHAANNMINDYFDSSGGVDTPGYVRALYAPHPILSGWVTRRQLAAAIVAVNVIDAGSDALPDRRPRAAHPGLRAGRAVHLGVLRRPADPAQAPRPGRARRVPGLGSADGRRHVPRRDRDDPGLGPAGLGALRAARDVRAVRQAHRQDRGGRGDRRPDAARDPRRVQGADGRLVADDRVLSADGARRGRRAASARGCCSWSSASRGC